MAVTKVFSVILDKTISEIETVAVLSGYFHFGKYHYYTSATVIAKFATAEFHQSD